MHPTIRGQRARIGLLVGTLLVAGTLAGCADRQPLAGSPEEPGAPVATQTQRVLQAFECRGSIEGGIACKPATAPRGGASHAILDGQGPHVEIDISNAGYDFWHTKYSFDVTVQNLMSEAIGTPGAAIADPDGIRVFFHSGPTVIVGTGTATVANADGTATFTAADQPYFVFPEILETNDVSASRTMELWVDSSVDQFIFELYVSAEVEYRLVINEVLVNPGGIIQDANGEWFELYNAGSLAVNLQGLLIADSAASGRRPYHTIASSVVVPAGGYAVLGIKTDTVSNGGVDVDYAYSTALLLANSLDAVKVSRVFGTDTLTVDRIRFSSAAISAQNGISRELKNPALDNHLMDGTNWADASASTVYGAGGRGTPGALNANFVP